MKKVLIAMITMALLLLPLLVYAQSAQNSKEAPPVSQALVPEGDFALKLVPALGLGTPNSEAQAEDMLTSVGIAPKNGWIADYPITPIVIGELQDAVAGASDAKKLPMEKVEALKAFHDLTADFGLSVLPGGSGEYAENRPQPDSTVIDNYYYEEGPPVVTYYPPPWDYYYLYDWVPYPFWWGGFSFTGFFSLRDFHRFVIFGHHRHLISNHFIDPRTHAVTRVDPVSHSSTRFAHTTAFDSKSTRNAASSIFNHSASSRGSRTFSNSNGSANRSGMNHQPSQSFGRSFSSTSGGGSTSCANCHGSSGSFGRSGSGTSSGGFSSGHSSGGFSGGHSSGGFSGGHSSGGFSGGGFSGSHGGGGRGR